jgi:sigma-B regulation protein RsbU (phosphoserine phosphatase)
MPAALYMALTRSLILAEAQRERSPRTVLSNVNRLLLELGRAEMFVTVFYGVVDTHAQRLTFCRAGHDCPLLLRDGTMQRLRGRGAFLGFLEQAELGLTEEQVDLFPGDRLVLYTDGLTDASTADGELLGLDRLCELLQSCTATTPSVLCDMVFASVFAYQGNAEQFDDMTMLVVQVGKET